MTARNRSVFFNFPTENVSASLETSACTLNDTGLCTFGMGKKILTETVMFVALFVALVCSNVCSSNVCSLVCKRLI